ncbi:MAG: prolipoprotein diacylglyceryl transferase [Gemmatimonadota bacterium]|nr:MAG: prolipoprotein diacylglyceryl transferase [Gemmatimonadota bacterium]
MRPRIVEYLVDKDLNWVASLTPTPGLMYALVVLVVAPLFAHRCRRSSIPLLQAFDAGIYAGIGAIIGTRLFYLVASGTIFQIHFAEWFSPRQGTASWGAYLGAMIAVVLGLRIRRSDPLPYLDAAASVAGLGIFIGRWSCFLNGDDFGRLTSAPWGIRYPPGSLAYLAQLDRGAIAATAELSLPTHPIQLILSLNGLALFLITSLVWGARRRRPGYTLAFFWLLYGATRFFWEFLRDPAAGGTQTFLSVSQWMSLALGLAGMIGLVVMRTRERRSVSAPGEPG